MSFVVSLIGILRFDSVCLWIAPRSPATMVTRGLVVHPMVFLSVWMRGLYLPNFFCMVTLGNLSW